MACKEGRGGSVSPPPAFALGVVTMAAAVKTFMRGEGLEESPLPHCLVGSADLLPRTHRSSWGECMTGRISLYSPCSLPCFIGRRQKISVSSL